MTEFKKVNLSSQSSEWVEVVLRAHVALAEVLAAHIHIIHYWVGIHLLSHAHAHIWLHSAVLLAHCAALHLTHASHRVHLALHHRIHLLAHSHLHSACSLHHHLLLAHHRHLLHLHWIHLHLVHLVHLDAGHVHVVHHHGRVDSGLEAGRRLGGLRLLRRRSATKGVVWHSWRVWVRRK